LIGLGGVNKHFDFDEVSLLKQIQYILTLYPEKKWFLFNSRRTPKNITKEISKLKNEFSNLIISEKGFDDVLEKASIKFITQDSVNMVYEALSTRGKTYLFNMNSKKENKITRQMDLLITNKQLGYIEKVNMAEGLGKIKIQSQSPYHEVFSEVEKVAYQLIKKLNLKPNQKVLDIGSGWGSLAIEIAKKSQCEVLGITLSENQFKHSVEKAKANGLENQVQFRLTDYRDLNEKFDRIVSVGMFEHVGRKFYNTYFNSVSKLLNDDGVALIHTIGSVNPPRDPHPWITKYIFPGGYTPSFSEVAKPIEKSGLMLSDLEVWRMHYSHTLRHWKERFLNKREQVLEMFDEKFLRMWEFYLAGCEMAFKWGDQVVFQMQLIKKHSAVPNTRDYIY